VPKTLLAVDDSATLRKVLEITFSGEDFKVVTADGLSAARSAVAADTSVVVLDTSIDGDAYAFARELRAKDPRLTIVLLSSRYNAYDAGKGREAGADDYMDKPFDTQQLIDKVKKAMLGRESGAGAAAAAPAARPAAAAAAAAAAATAPTQTTPSLVSPFAAPSATKPVAVTPASPNPPAVAAKPAAASVQRTHTLSFENTPMPPGAAKPAAAPPAARPQPQPTPAPMPAIAAPVAASVNGQLAGKLEGLGLTASQADAVLALSREVVERVVWEVVPQLAEAIIKEEIARLTKE
jgi:CheY-like chemotaxis protein